MKRAYELYASLPFIEIATKKEISLGPVHFWPASEIKPPISKDLTTSFPRFIQTIRQFKAKIHDEWVSTGFLPSITCVSIDTNYPNKEELLIDSLYLLYFATTFRNIYYGDEIPAFDSFTKFISSTEDFIKDEKNWNSWYIPEAKRQNIACITWVDEELCRGLGEVLKSAYGEEKSEKSLGLIRSIRYFVDRFYTRFENLAISDPSTVSSKNYDVEDILFLSSSFDTLLNINEIHSASDFRQKIRPMLHLKFSRPLELFWKWVDGFYCMKKKIMNCESIPDQIFRENPNLEVPYIHVGVKLYIYTVYYILHEYHLVETIKDDPYSPPDFKWIHPQEVLLFFWSEESILKKIALLLMQLENTKKQEENKADVSMLASLYVSYINHFMIKDHPIESSVRFVPTPSNSIEQFAHPIIDFSSHHKNIFPKEFLSLLHQRLNI